MLWQAQIGMGAAAAAPATPQSSIPTADVQGVPGAAAMGELFTAHPVAVASGSIPSGTPFDSSGGPSSQAQEP